MAKKDDGHEIAGIVIAIAAVVAMGAMWLLIRPFKGRLSQAFNLEQRSFGYKYWNFILEPVRWACALAAALTAVIVLSLGSTLFLAPAHKSVIEGIIWLVVCFSGFIIFALIFALITFAKEYSEDAELQRKLAGKYAEEAVERCLTRAIDAGSGAAVIHGGFFCFNINTPSEYSIEVDHIYVTGSNVYVIETKYKSGQVVVNRRDPSWEVVRNNRKTTMRNALLQVENTKNVLVKEMQLTNVVPIVAIVGDDLVIKGDVPNVVAVGGLMELIDSYEILAKGYGNLNSHELVRRFSGLHVSDSDAMKRHIARIRIRYGYA